MWEEGFDEAVELKQLYGNPLSGEAAAARFGTDRAIVTQAALLLRDSSKIAKDRHQLPRISEKDFFRSLVNDKSRYFFSGYLNSWAGLTLLELASIEEYSPSLSKKGKIYWSAVGRMPKSKKSMISMKFREKNNNDIFDEPRIPKSGQVFLLNFYKPSWTEKGYINGIKGFVWYYSGSGLQDDSKKISVGTNIVDAANNYDKKHHGKMSRAVRAYHFGHRYAKLSESRKDKISYHTGVFIEWDHGKYGTVVELAWCYGISGYDGRSNWVQDTEGYPTPALFKKFPGEMKMPFTPKRSEVRCIDVDMKNKAEFETFLAKHNGPRKRFIDPKIKYSSEIRLVHNTKADIFRSLLNRIIKNFEYAEPSIKKTFGWNCQTFAAGFYGYLTKEAPKSFTLGFSLHARLKLYEIDYMTGTREQTTYKKKEKKKKEKKKKKKNGRGSKSSYSKSSKESKN